MNASLRQNESFLCAYNQSFWQPMSSFTALSLNIYNYVLPDTLVEFIHSPNRNEFQQTIMRK